MLWGAAVGQLCIPKAVTFPIQMLETIQDQDIENEILAYVGKDGRALTDTTREY